MAAAMVMVLRKDCASEKKWKREREWVEGEATGGCYALSRGGGVELMMERKIGARSSVH